MLGLFRGSLVCPGVSFLHLPDGFAPAPQFDPFQDIRNDDVVAFGNPSPAHIDMTVACQFHEVAPGSTGPFAPSVSSGGELLMDFLEGAVAVLVALPGWGVPAFLLWLRLELISGLKLKRIR